MRRFLPVALVALLVLASQLVQPNTATAQANKDQGIKVVHRVSLPPGRTATFAQVSADGSRFGVGLDSNEIVMWDGKTGKELYRLPGAGPVFTANGKFVAAYSGATLRVFDPVKGKELQKTDFAANIHGMLHLPNETRLVVWTADGKAHAYAAESGKVLHSWPFYPDSFFAWTPDGNVLFLRFKQGESYRALDVQSGKPADGYGKIVKNNRIFAVLPAWEQALVEEGSHSYLVNIKTGARVKEIPDRTGPKVVAGGRGHTNQRYELLGNVRGRLSLMDIVDDKEVAALTLPDGEKSVKDHTIGLSPGGLLGCVATNHSVYMLRLSPPIQILIADPPKVIDSGPPLITMLVKGKIKNLDTDKNTITLVVENKDLTLALSRDVQVVALFGNNLKDAKLKDHPAGLKAIKEGSRVVVSSAGFSQNKMFVSQIQLEELQMK